MTFEDDRKVRSIVSSSTDRRLLVVQVTGLLVIRDTLVFLITESASSSSVSSTDAPQAAAKIPGSPVPHPSSITCLPSRYSRFKYHKYSAITNEDGHEKAPYSLEVN